MSTIAERIIQIVNEKEGGNKRKFALKVEISPPYVTQITKNREMVPSNLVLDKIISVYGVNRLWLYDGIGDPFPEPSLGDALGEIAAAASHQNVDAVREYFRDLGDHFTDAEILFLYEIFQRHFGKPKESDKE